MVQENKSVTPKLTLVGAGPGDPDLITVKALKALQQANVVMYDALVDKRLLEHAPKAVKVFVGKRGGKQYLCQADINQLIVQNALNHGHVVRLKGGDSFVFGRGHEEQVHAQSFGIDVEVVPGITSAIAVPELQGIPVTRRGIAESFWVLTATNKSDELSSDIALAVQSTATVVILMGTRKLPQIISLYEKAGRGAEHIAVIQNGSLKDEKVALGQMSNIQEEVDAKGIGSPAVIVIGEVVRAHPQLLAAYLEEAKVKS